MLEASLDFLHRFFNLFCPLFQRWSLFYRMLASLKTNLVFATKLVFPYSFNAYVSFHFNAFQYGIALATQLTNYVIIGYLFVIFWSQTNLPKIDHFITSFPYVIRKYQNITEFYRHQKL